MNSAPRAPVVAVGAVVVREDGRVLVVKRGRPPRAGTWSLPGGHVQRDEALEAAVVREVLEETGLTVRVQVPLCVVRIDREGFCYDIHEFYCSVDGPCDATAGDDAVDVAWADDQDLATLAVSPEVSKVIDRARSLLPSRPCRVGSPG